MKQNRGSVAIEQNRGNVFVCREVVVISGGEVVFIGDILEDIETGACEVKRPRNHDYMHNETRKMMRVCVLRVMYL